MAYRVIYDSRRFVRDDSADATIPLPIAAGGTGTITGLVVFSRVTASPSSSGATFSANSQLRVEANGDAGLEIGTPNANISRIILSTPAGAGSVTRWDYTNLRMDIGTAVAGGALRLLSGNFATAVTISGATQSALLAAPLTLKGYTVATLPAGVQGYLAFCTDLLLPSFLAVAVGGGAVVGMVFFDGTNYVTV